MHNTVTEVERRFLITDDVWRQHAREDTKVFIKQAYPDSLQKDGQFGRIRSTFFPSAQNTLYEEGYKGKQVGLETPETEWEIGQRQFDALMREAGVQSLAKWRWTARCRDYVFMVDQFTHIRHDRSTLIIAEVEFVSAEKATIFSPPNWFGPEVTSQHRWSNLHLCLHGEPLLTV